MFKVLVKVMIHKGRKLLVLKRAPSNSNPGKWDFPGGNLKNKEGVEIAVRREAKEEASLSIGNIELFDASSMHFPGRDYVTIIYKTNSFKGKIKISDEHSAFAWLELKELNKKNLNPVLVHAVEKLKKEMNG